MDIERTNNYFQHLLIMTYSFSRFIVIILYIGCGDEERGVFDTAERL